MRKSSSGYFLIIAVILVLVIGLLGTVISDLFVNTAQLSVAQSNGLNAFYNAESALEIGTRLLTMPNISGTPTRLTCAGINGTAAITNATLGSGKFTITTINSSPIFEVDSLSSAAGAADTTINVTNATGFAPQGRVLIDNEAMDYAAISGNSFIGVTRGTAGTTAASHVSGDPVGQYQCALDAKAGIPNLTSPSYQRELQWGVQLQNGYTVGNFSGSNNTIAGWNYPTEMTWNNVTVAGAINLTDISMISYADGWAVGSSLTFLHWNGSAWTSVATGLSGSTYPGIFCSASDDCHVVGKTRKIAHYDGTGWTNLSATGSLASTDLESVSCDSPTDCWAVGSNAGGGKFYQGTGSPISWVGIDQSSLTGFNFNDVVCNSSTDCWAVGANATFGRLTSGTAWTNYATGLPATQYNGIFCNSTSDCWVVGNASTNDVIAHWNGTAWTLNTSNPTPVANLNDVACTNTNDCWAVGAAVTGGNPVFVHWNGSTWTQVTVSGLPSAVALNAISLIGPASQPQSTWLQVYN